MEKGTWYQRELAILEVMCDADLVNEQSPKIQVPITQLTSTNALETWREAKGG